MGFTKYSQKILFAKVTLFHLKVQDQALQLLQTALRLGLFALQRQARRVPLNHSKRQEIGVRTVF